MILLGRKNFRLDIEWNWSEFGVGGTICKPLFRPFPRKNFWFGFSLRIFWLAISFKLIDRAHDVVYPEIHDANERMKELSSFHYKELIRFKNQGSIDVYWQWNNWGISIYFRSPNKNSGSGRISVDIMWFSISFNFSRMSQIA